MLIVRALDGTVLGSDTLNDRSIVVQVTVAALRGDNRLPLLLIKAEHKDGLGTSCGIGREISEHIVVDFSDCLHFADLLAVHILKLGVKRDVITDRAIFILELLEADA